MNALDVKAAARARDNYCCTRCGMTRAQHFASYDRDLHVHRISPGSEYTVAGCITVCYRCHGPLPRSPHGTRPPRPTEQVRMPVDLMNNVRATASIQGESAPEFVVRAVRELLKKEMPKAAREMARRAQQAGEPPAAQGD